jgi:hypothetical protein
MGADIETNQAWIKGLSEIRSVYDSVLTKMVGSTPGGRAAAEEFSPFEKVRPSEENKTRRHWIE